MVHLPVVPRQVVPDLVERIPNVQLTFEQRVRLKTVIGRRRIKFLKRRPLAVA